MKPGDKVVIMARDYFEGKIGVLDTVGHLLKVKLNDKGSEHVIKYRRNEVVKAGE